MDSVIRAVAGQRHETLRGGPGTLSGGARCIWIGYAARGDAGLHGGCVVLPTEEPPMSIEVIPTGAALGAEIRGVDLAGITALTSSRSPSFSRRTEPLRPS